MAGGFRSTVRATRGTTGRDILIGSLGNGTLTVFDGGLVETSSDMFIASNVGALGELVLFGRNGLVGEVRVGDDLFVAGSRSAFGGRGNVLLSGGCLLAINDVLKVWPDGSVEIDEGTLRAGHIDLTDAEPAAFNFILGRIEANRISGNLENFEGTVAAGAATITTMTLDGDYRQFRGAEFEIELAGASPGIEHDVADITGIATLDGTLRVVVDPGFTPAVGQTFTVMTFASRVGEFAGLVVDGSGTFDLRYVCNTPYNWSS